MSDNSPENKEKSQPAFQGKTQEGVDLAAWVNTSKEGKEYLRLKIGQGEGSTYVSGFFNDGAKGKFIGFADNAGKANAYEKDEYPRLIVNVKTGDKEMTAGLFPTESGLAHMEKAGFTPEAVAKSEANLARNAEARKERTAGPRP
jgi:hypothetical protein